MKRIKVSAPGKVILTGEHSVVYNKPAVLTAIDLRLSLSLEEREGEDKMLSPEPEGLLEYGVEKLKEYYDIEFCLRVEVDSQIPVGCGLGSSAALSSALSGAFRRFAGKRWDLEEINRLAYQIEKKQHGNPSGGDNTVSTHGGFIRFQKQPKEGDQFIPLRIEKKWPLLLLDSGKPEESTGEMVDLVRLARDKKPQKVKRVLGQMGEVSERFLELLAGQEEVSLRAVIKENEKLLEELGVVSVKARDLIRQIEKRGGAAKITGAGGIKQGSGMVLVYHDKLDTIRSWVKKKGLKVFSARLGEEGLRDETD